MKYLWTEDTGAGLHFWKLVNQLFFNDALVVESKESNQGLLDTLSDIDMKEDDKYYIAFDYVVDNQDIRNKYRMLKSIADKAEGKIIILDMICFEYLILAFDKLVAWTGTGKTDKIKIREDVLSAIEDHRINLSKIDDEKTLQYFEDIKEGFVEDYIPLPGQYDINEYRIMEEFIYELPAGKNQDVLVGAIQGRGAFRRFKDKLYDLNLEKQWYQYRDEAYEKIARQWCERHKIDLVE